MPEVLRDTTLEERRTLLAPAPVWDQATRTAMDGEVAAAEARGHAAGLVEGRAAAEAGAARTVAGLTATLDRLHAEVRSQRAAASVADLAVVEAVLDAVLAVCPPAPATVLLERVREAAELLDDEVLEVRLHADDLDAIAGAPMDHRLRPVAAPGVAPGEAQVLGDWGRAELTRAALTRAALAALSPPDALPAGGAQTGPEAGPDVEVRP